jgi:hypothetical protein
MWLWYPTVELDNWMVGYLSFWEGSFDALDERLQSGENRADDG